MYNFNPRSEKIYSFTIYAIVTIVYIKLIIIIMIASSKSVIKLV